MKGFFKKLKNFQIILPIVFIIWFLLDVFYFQNNSDLRFFSLLFLWILISWIYHLKSDVTFKLCLVFLLIIFFFTLFNKNPVRIERLSVWLFLFLGTGVIQQIIEFKAKARIK